jgi:hypothetical protein
MKIFIIIAIILITTIQNKAIYAQTIEIEDSLLFYKAVQEGINKYLNKIPLGKEQDFGFNSRDEFAKIRFGNPMPIYVGNENLYTDSNIIDTFYCTERWKLPLIVDNKYKCFLDVINNNGYKTVGLGLCELAYDVENYMKYKKLMNTKSIGLFMDNSLKIYCLVLKNQIGNLDFMSFRAINMTETPEIENKEKYSGKELYNILKTKNEILKQNEN